MQEKFSDDITLISRLAKGGMGEVFLGVQTGPGGLERRVAVKRVFKHLCSKKSFREMFEREVNLSSRLQHPNIVQVISSGNKNGYLYYVMEYLPGKHVAQIIERALEENKNIPLPFILQVISEASEGLNYAHSLSDEKTGQPLNLVHRDISPSNVMIGFNGSVKLLDFGIAKASNSLDLTKTGVLKGKFRYLAPERVLGQGCDARSDLFSLGVVFYEMLSREHFFAGEGSMEILEKIARYKTNEFNLILPTIPQEISDILSKLLCPNPSQRYKSGEELNEDLKSAQSKLYPNFSKKDFRKVMSDFFPDESSAKSYSYKISTDLKGTFEKISNRNAFLSKKKIFTVAVATLLILVATGSALSFSNILKKIIPSLAFTEEILDQAEKYKPERFPERVHTLNLSKGTNQSIKLSSVDLSRGVVLMLTIEADDVKTTNSNLIEIRSADQKTFFKLNLVKSTITSELQCGLGTCIVNSEKKAKSGVSHFRVLIQNKGFEVKHNGETFIEIALDGLVLDSNEYILEANRDYSQIFGSNNSKVKFKDLVVLPLQTEEALISGIETALAVRHNLPAILPQ